MTKDSAGRLRNTSLIAQIRLVTLAMTIILSAGLIFMMTFFMNSLTDKVLLAALRPVAKTAAQSLEASLHTLAERFFMLRDNEIIASHTSSVATKQQILDKVVAGVEFTWIALYRPDGSLLVGSAECPPDIGGKELFSTIKTTGNLAIDDPSIGFRGAEIIMGLPVYAATTADGQTAQPLYYLLGGYNYDVLTDILDKINISPNGMIFIINPKGQFVAHKNMDKVFRGESIVDNFDSGPDGAEVFKAMAQGQTGAAEISGAASKIYVSYAPVRGTLWSLGIHAPRQDYIIAERQAQIAGALVTIAFLIIFFVFLTIFFRRIIEAPLQTITTKASQLADGKFARPLNPQAMSRRDEIGQLAAAFHSMAGSIHGLIQEMRHLTTGARIGKLGERADYTAYRGDYRRILSGFNATLDVFCSYLDILPVALALLDETRRVLYHNKAMDDWRKRHGWGHGGDRSCNPDGDSGGNNDDLSPLFALLTAESGGELDPAVATLFSPQGGQAFQTDLSIADTAGAERNYELGLWRVGDDAAAAEHTDNRPVCVMLLINDVTQLARARDAAEAASRAKGDFLARMSHEMRTPMNAIIGMTAIGQSAAEVERKEYSLNKISEASQYLLGIINDVLDLSKIEAGKLELIREKMNFADMLLRVLDVIRFSAEAKKQTITVNIDADMPASISGDKQRLSQVALNLLSNAVKFTPEGGSITLRAEKIAATADTCTILVEVRDTGIGIAPEHIQRLFTPFEQADGGFSRKYGGTGLGLAISKHIIELMGGSIRVESVPGQGTSFFWEFTARPCCGDDLSSRLSQPLSPHAAPDASCNNAGNLENTGGAGKNADLTGIFSGKHILIAEDVAINREIIAALIEPTEVDIDFASNGEEAVARFAAAPHKYGLILMDLQMPSLDGFEATRRIRASGLPGAATVPIIAMTANVFREDVEQCLTAGMNGHLGKPVNLDETIATLSRYLS